MRGGLYGLISGVAFHFAANRFSPKYRGLTVQFRTFIQLGFVFTGACWLIDTGLVEYERKIASEQRALRIKKLEDAVESGEYTYFSNNLTKKKRAVEQVPEGPEASFGSSQGVGIPAPEVGPKSE